MQLVQYEVDGKRAAGLQINDRPDSYLDYAQISKLGTMKDWPEKEAAQKRWAEEEKGGMTRVFIARMTTIPPAWYFATRMGASAPS